MNMSNLVHAMDSTLAFRKFTDKNGVEWKYVGKDSRGRNYWEKTGRKSAYVHRHSSHTKRQQQERDRVLQARLQAEGHKSELMCLAYGGRPITDDGKLLVSGWKAIDQRSTIKHTTHGDFSHLHATPLICK
ncbi:hypothetical protein [Escherichia phage TM1]|uniref:Uncharacterized protein n=1 Tax=Escherichia phage TM1 TaxID=2762279 RepID=A0ABY4XT49_9CAUD|nr:hypothetical protein [Escherichia phage TM1]